MTKIDGFSDDLIEIQGEISDEVYAYSETNFKASDGTKGKIEFSTSGEWKITLKTTGTLFNSLIESVGEDNYHEGLAEGCTRYSDVLIFNDGLEWIKIGKKTLKAD